MSTLHFNKLAQCAINYLTKIVNLNWTDTWNMAQCDNHPDPKTRKDNNIGKNWRPISLLCPAAKTLEELMWPKMLTHPFPPCSTWLSAKTLDMHCTVDDHRRHCCRLLNKKAGSPNSARRARSDSCIRQCGPSTTARMCLQHQHTGSNPSLALQLYAEQTSQCSFSSKRIYEPKGENRCVTRRSSVSSALQLLCGRLSNTASEHQADQVRRWHYHLHILTSGGRPNQWPQHISVASAQVHQQQINWQCQRPNLQQYYSRQTHTSTTYIHKWRWPTKYYRSKRSQKS